MKKIIWILWFASVLQVFSERLYGNHVGLMSDDSTSILLEKRYKLYPTENMWTFIKLDTRTGKMWQVQYSLEDEQRFEVVLNDYSLLLSRDKEEDGRYELYPTQNMYNFILLDKKEGWTYQVQWSLKKENRIVLPIR